MKDEVVLAPSNTGLGLVRCVILSLASLAASLFSPSIALLLAWIGVVLSASEAPEHVSWPLVAFAHAGALIFASRSFDAASSDFVNYHAVYAATCHGATDLEDTFWAFGIEIGLPVFYQLLSALGICELSINGLAWLQGFITASALLLVISRWVRQVTRADELPMTLAGLCLMFSFFYTTQLSRQAASSIFVLSALWLAHTRRRITLLLLLATLFHLTAPLVWGLAVLIRASFKRALPALLAVALISLLAFDKIVAFAVEHAGAFEPLAKLAIYSLPSDSGGPQSDLQAVVLLGVSGLMFAWRARHESGLAGDTRLLLGFSLLALVLLPVPLAATRLTLPLAWIAIGAFLFRGFAGTSRMFGWLALLLLLVLRVGVASMPGNGEHALWTAFPPAAWIPAYWLLSF